MEDRRHGFVRQANGHSVRGVVDEARRGRLVGRRLRWFPSVAANVDDFGRRPRRSRRAKSLPEAVALTRESTETESETGAGEGAVPRRRIGE